MFDDQIKNAGNVPGNLPIDEPEDIFSDSASSQNPPVNEIKTALDAGILRPAKKQNVSSDAQTEFDDIPNNSTKDSKQDFEIDKVSMQTPPFEDLENTDIPPSSMKSDSYDLKDPNFGKIIFLIVGLVIVGGVVIGGSIFAYRNFFSENDSNSPINSFPTETQLIDTLDPLAPAPSPTETSSFPIAEPSDMGDSIPPRETVSSSTAPLTTTTGEVLSPFEENILFGSEVDTDEDGITDTEEQKLGTDPKNWDTDGDGLSDQIEIKIWESDPLNPDSDADGYEDGLEVRSGYSPVGNEKISTDKPVVSSLSQ